MKVIGWHPIKRWEGVALGAFVVEGEGKPQDMVFCFDDVNPDFWTAVAILKNWGHHLSVRFLRAREVKADGSRRPAHTRDLATWVKATRQLADEASYVLGDGSAGAMRRAADEVEESLSWANERFVSPPRDSRKLVEFLWAADLWAFSEVLTIFHDVGGNGAKEISREKFLRRILGPAFLEMEKQGLPAPESDAWKMTIRRIKGKVRAGKQEAVIADVLSAMRLGPFDRNGKEIPAPSG